MSIGNSQDVLDRLLDYRADVGVLAQVFRDGRFVSVPFSEHPVLIFCSTGHRFAKRRSIRTAELQGRGSWSAKRVRRRAGRVRISGTQIRTYAHVVCLAERQEMRMVRVFYEVIAGRTTAGKIRAA